MKKSLSVLTGGLLCALFISAPAFAAGDPQQARLDSAVNQTIQPLLKEYAIPGMAVAVTWRGKHYFYNFGLASKEGAVAVTQQTLFELGSVSKTFAATLAAYAQATGALSLDDKAARYLPPLAGGKFDNISLLNLGTYTAGGLPLQFPDEVGNDEQMVSYFQRWQPEYAPGTHRRYSNPSLGLFGYLTARAMGDSYSTLVEQRLLPPLGLQHTYIRVPQAQMKHYAYGYNKQDNAVRVNPGVLDAEAYGVKSSAQDMIKFVDDNINPAGLSAPLQQAIRLTQSGYFKLGAMVQGLGWEHYAYPVTLDQLLAGNSAQVAYQTNPVEALTPPQPPQAASFFNKTGSTNGFGAYVAFIPAKQLGIVLLANRNYPNDARIKAAYRILQALE